MVDIVVIDGFTKNFLIKTAEGYLLIDTFLPKKYNRFLKKLEKLNINVSDIKFLLLTHHHIDHVGFVKEFRENHNVRMIVHEKAISYLTEGKMENYTKPLNFIARVVMFFVKLVLGMSCPPIEITSKDIVIKEDKSMILKSLMGLDAIILRTPGSTDDNLSIIFDDGQTITGDVILNLPWPMKFRNQPVLITTKDNFIRSWKLLKTHNAKILHPSHGKELTIEKLSANLAKIENK
ncbi:MAG: MBL fold metallo-hydrolase [Asgard group archaeon]|nr:MBL fold metallo-hydrolase [Asgard group archaeon]